MLKVAALRQAFLCLLAVPVLFVSASVHAQSYSSPEDEFKRRVHVSEELDPLGEDALGDHINLYDGTLTFSNVDVRESGLGPDMIVARRFIVPDENTGVAFHPFHSNAFVDWDLDLPSIETLSAPTKVTTNGIVSWQWYLVDDYYGQVRCSGLGQAPTMYVGTGVNIATYTSDQWWHGYHLNTPDGEQTILRRASANSQSPSITDDAGHAVAFPLVTKEHWAIGCLASTSNGAPGEGYLAVSPAGVKYYLDVLVQRSADAVMGSAGQALKRKVLKFVPSKVVDRFGNAVTYSYDANGNLIAMQASDGGSGNGRRIELTWEQWQAPTNDPGPSTSPATQYTSFRVTKITEQPSAASPRTWTYTYSSDPLLPRLTQVTLPDGTSWQYSLGGLPATNADSLISYTGAQGTCNYSLYPNTATMGTGTVTGPSGLSGTFVARTAIRGRSKVPVACSNVHVTGLLPRVYAVTSIQSKTLSGPGMSPQTWSYAYGPTNESWLETCSGCQTTVTTTVTDPSGNSTVRTFSNAFDSTESLLLSTDAYSGTPSGSPMQHETRSYATSGPWPSPIGASNELVVNEGQVAYVVPQASDSLSENDGDMYSWSVTAFDEFGHPTALTKSSNTNATALVETLAYLNDQSLWVIGLQTTTTNAANGDVMSQTTYGGGDVPSERYVFGRKIESYGFDGHGQLIWVKDGLGHITTFAQQVRGVPTQISYADQTTESFGLNEFGEVASHTDRSGHSVSYGYDAVGRVNREQWSGVDGTWDPISIQYASVSTAERGIAAGHFRRIWTQGDHARSTYYDARLQPILADEYRASDGGLRSTARTDFDWRGHTTKVYRPLSGAASIGDFGKGTATAYDALGRVSSVTVDTEIPATPTATTSTTYLSGGRLQVTDSTGNVVVSGYQMFDTPDYRTNISLAGSGITQTTTRDVYGNVVRLDQSGDVSVSKSFAYDSHYQLCRITEPETGSYIASYDDAGNIAWSAKGVAYSPSADEHDCGQSAVQPSQKITRGYDPSNRLTSVAYADGSPTDTFEYSGTDLITRSSSGGVTRTFTYNSLDKVTSEQLAIDGLSWTMGYAYNSSGALNAMTYPDGTVVAMVPDALGRQTAVGSFASGAQYHPDGKLAGFSFGSGQVYTAAENDRGFINSLGYGTGGSQPVAEDFVYDLQGRVTQVSDVSGGSSRNQLFSYDGLNRLASATDIPVWGGDIYAYNALGDITSIKNGGATSTFQYTSNKLTGISAGGTTLSYAFDTQGNLTQRGADNFTFDQAGRLTGVVGKATYAYDAMGIRAKSLLASGDATYFVYSRGGLLLMSYSTSTGNVTDHFYLGNKPVATQASLAAPITGPALTVPATATAGTAFTASWASVAHASTYTFQQSVSGGSFSTLATQSGNSYTITAPSAGTYAYRAQACNAGGCGPWSAVGTVVVAAPPQAPSPPATVTANAAGDLSSITIGWSASGSATSYIVQYRPVGGNWVTLTSTAGLTTTWNSPPDATYQFQVEACAAPGCSTWTASGTVTIAHLPTTPASISVPATNAGALTVSWSAATYATSYTLEKGVGGTYAAYVTTAATSSAVSLPSSGTYTFRVMACNANGCGGYSPVGQTQATLVPASAPSIATSGNSSSGAYSVSWSTVTDGASYVLQEQVNGGGWTTVQSAAATNWSTSGRGNGTYGYRVQACNTSGCGPWSGTASLVVTLIPATPGYVTLTQSGPSNKRSTTVTWAAVANATSYQLQETVTPVGGTSVVYNGTGTSYIERALGVSGTLTFHVMACNANGCSAYGPSSSIQVLNGN